MRFMGKAAAVGAGIVTAIGAAAITATPAAAADGHLYAWDLINKGGVYCDWEGNDYNWASCDDRDGTQRSMRNKASSLHNNGFTYAVNLYYSPLPANGNPTSAWACLSRGDYWSNLTWRGFTGGRGLPGYGQGINNNIAAHKWVFIC